MLDHKGTSFKSTQECCDRSKRNVEIDHRGTIRWISKECLMLRFILKECCEITDWNALLRDNRQDRLPHCTQIECDCMPYERRVDSKKFVMAASPNNSKKLSHAEAAVV